MAEGRSRILVISLLVGFGLSLFLLGRLIFSGLSILDDHMVISWLGSDFHARVASTELAQYGSGPRFRPTMYLTIIFESLLFGDQAAFYRPLQIIMLATFLWAFAWASFRSVGYIVGACLLFLVADGRYWGNIWTHSLFPSEQFACLGLGLVIFGIGGIWSWYVGGRARRIDREILLVSLGCLICIGAKENFLPLVPLNILLLAWVWQRQSASLSTLAVCVVVIALELFICYGIIVPNIGRSTDMYGDNNSLLYRFGLIFHTKRFLLRPLLAFAGSAGVGLYCWINRTGLSESKRRQGIALSILLAWVGIYACWEQFFYSGQLPANQRYDFPALFVDPILLATAYIMILEVRSRVPAFARQFSVLALQIGVLLLMLPVAVSSADHGRLFSLRTAVAISNRNTGAMTADLEQIRSITAAHPNWPIIVRVDRPLNYEAVLTLPLWLKHFRIANDASVLVDVPPRESSSPLLSALVNVMRDQSDRGSSNGYRPYPGARARAEAEGHCFAIEFGPSKTPCIALPYHPANYYPQETF